MNGAEIKFYKDRSGLIAKADVRRFIDSDEISEYTITIGSELVVKPMNKQKLKHRDRRVKVLSFNLSDTYGERVNIQFLDNNRRGIIEIRDLENFR
ncbi:hypothetical protein CSV72_02110 [Sporosarcina sp. P20a]|uniref:hypothetical protein n=1 Tax=Sporosarcina sp. P20a TaxID=2048256 RepID=UPI000C172ECE|nr:hypothetical protein [Sporosarcina sp. P20a]PIC87964.1 hypothetical protein CSV72_02110 [Sporosarcina sp. P20a]